MTSIAWLEERLSETPEPLRARLESTIAELDPDVELGLELLRAAGRLLEGIRDHVEEREAAIDLLVADGLLTLACEAAAYSDPERLAESCRAMGPDGELGLLAGRWAGGS